MVQRPSLHFIRERESPPPSQDRHTGCFALEFSREQSKAFLRRISFSTASQSGNDQEPSSSHTTTSEGTNDTRAIEQVSRASMTSNDSRVSGATFRTTTDLSMRRWLQETPSEGPWSVTSRLRDQEPTGAVLSEINDTNEGVKGENQAGKGKVYPNFNCA